MSRFTKGFLALSLLVLPMSSAFAESEGNYTRTVVASPASGPAVDQGVGSSFAYGQGEGAQADSHPASAASGVARGPAVAKGEFSTNPGLNG